MILWFLLGIIIFGVICVLLLKTLINPTKSNKAREIIKPISVRVELENTEIEKNKYNNKLFIYNPSISSIDGTRENIYIAKRLSPESPMIREYVEFSKTKDFSNIDNEDLINNINTEILEIIKPNKEKFYKILNKSNIDFSVSPCGYEDPRIFNWKGEKWVIAYKRDSEIFNGFNHKIIIFNINDPEKEIYLNYSSRKLEEKNWMPFEHQGKLLMIYSFNPYIVLEISNDGKCTELIKEQKRDIDIKLDIGLGTPPILINEDTFLCMAHIRDKEKIPIRKNFFFTINSKNLQIGSHTPVIDFTDECIEFGSGLDLLDNGNILLSLGINDHYYIFGELPLKFVLNLMPKQLNTEDFYNCPNFIVGTNNPLDDKFKNVKYFKTHKEIWKKIFDEKISRANIFEDNITFTKNWDYISQFIRDTDPSVNIIFMGNQIEKDLKKEVVKTPNLCLCAYNITYVGAEKLHHLKNDMLTEMEKPQPSFTWTCWMGERDKSNSEDKPTVTFVSAYIDLSENEDRSIDRSFKTSCAFFRKLAQTKIKICLFVSKKFYLEAVDICKENPNVLLMPTIEFKELWTYKVTESISGLIMPENRTSHHDTYNFFTLINAKIEFVTKIIELNPFNTTHFSWIDFSVCHVINSKNPLDRLYTFSRSALKDKMLVFPGVWSKKISDDNFKDIYSKVNWRFCGGFFLGDKDSVLEFNDAYRKHYYNFLKEKKRFFWEVNFWAWLEYNNHFKPHVYMANFDDTILDIPSEYLKVVVSLTTIPSRHKRCRSTILSLLDQADHIYLSSSTNYERFGKAELPNFSGTEFKGKVTVIDSPDYGPATKYLGALKNIPDNSWVMVCDDDQVFNSNVILQMKNSVQNLGGYQNRYDIVKKGSGGIIHGFVGNMFHKSCLNKLLKFDLPSSARFVDDQWMSIYCFINNIPIFPTKLNTYPELFSVLTNNHEGIGEEALSSLNNRDTMLKELSDYFGVIFVNDGNIKFKNGLDNKRFIRNTGIIHKN